MGRRSGRADGREKKGILLVHITGVTNTCSLVMSTPVT